MKKKDNLIRAKIIKGLEIAHKKLIQAKKDRNLDLVVSDNGKIVHIHPKDLQQIKVALATHAHENMYHTLQTISLQKYWVIGPLTSSALITELGDINRFPHIDHLSSFVGLIPRVKQSGESSYSGGITFRCNEYLRTLLIESSWQAIRQDPALMQYYHQHIINNKGQKVIIKVARKLLNRIRYVMKNRQPYVTGVA